MLQSVPRIVIPDDAPPVMAASDAHRRLLQRVDVDYHDTLPGTEDRLIERMPVPKLSSTFDHPAVSRRTCSANRPSCACCRCGAQELTM